jgi:secondary thiamine-phosphate synthase enzyme
METFTVETGSGVDVTDVTDRVRSAADPAADRVTVFVPHTTAGVVLNEAESRLLADLERFVGSLATVSGADTGEGDGTEWAHDALDGNAAAHLRASALGASETIPVVEGDLALGTWQSVLLVECDGPRSRSVRVV